MDPEKIFLLRYLAEQVQKKLEAILPNPGRPENLQFQIDLLTAHGSHKFAPRIEKLQKDLKLMREIQKENEERIWLLREELKVYRLYLSELENKIPKVA